MVQAARPTGAENTAAGQLATINLSTSEMAAQRLGVTPSLIVIARESIDEPLNRLPPLPA